MKRFVKDANAVKDYQIDWVTKGFLGVDTISTSTFTPAENLWIGLKAYRVGERVRLAGGSVLEATVAGTTANSSPTPPSVGSTVVDGTVTWLRSFSIDGTANTTTTTTVTVRGGTGWEYGVINHIVTVGGREEDEMLVFLIIEK